MLGTQWLWRPYAWDLSLLQLKRGMPLYFPGLVLPSVETTLSTGILAEPHPPHSHCPMGLNEDAADIRLQDTM